MKERQLSKYKLPDAPGIYFFLGPRGKILYIGKATSLRDRVRSYFSGDVARMRGEHIARMVEAAVQVDFEKTDSVLEALILEANLIKKHKPPFNSREKDDTSFNYLVITKEEFPRVLIVRGKDLQTTHYPPALHGRAGKLQATYGPFPHAGQFKEAMRIVQKIFPFYDTNEPVADMVRTERGRKKLLFNAQIRLYPGIPYEDVSREEYAQTIRHIKLFFEGKKRTLIGQLEREMKAYAKGEEFEKAAEVRRKIFALQHIQDVALIKDKFRMPFRDFSASFPYHSASFRTEAYDISHISGTDTVGALAVVESGIAKKSDYRKFRMRGSEFGNDIAALKEVLSRRLGHSEWHMPNLIVVDGGKAQKSTALKMLKECGMSIHVVSVVKDEYHRPREILGEKEIVSRYEKDILLANAEAHRFALSYHRKLRARS